MFGNISALMALNRIKNNSIFTRDQNVFEYTSGLKFRLSQYYGVDTKDWDYKQIVEFLKKNNEIK